MIGQIPARCKSATSFEPVCDQIAQWKLALMRRARSTGRYTVIRPPTRYLDVTFGTAMQSLFTVPLSVSFTIRYTGQCTGRRSWRSCL